MDVASPGWTWRPRDGRGVPGMDVASPGWTWDRRDGRGERPGSCRCRHSDIDVNRAVWISTGRHQEDNFKVR